MTLTKDCLGFSIQGKTGFDTQNQRYLLIVILFFGENDREHRGLFAIDYLLLLICFSSLE